MYVPGSMKHQKAFHYMVLQYHGTVVPGTIVPAPWYQVLRVHCTITGLYYTVQVL